MSDADNEYGAVRGYGIVGGVSAAELEALYRSRYARFVAVAGAIAGLDAAHDVVQDAFARALRGAGRFRGDAIEAWMWKIVVNVARDAARARRADAPLDAAALALSVLDAERDPALMAALRALPPRRRAVVFLRHLADLPLDEIARLLEISPGTVSATLAQARAALRAALTEGVPR